MREIKFRGKPLKNGQWVYGCYTFSKKDNRHIIWVQSDDNAETWHTLPIPVDGKTIGQFTGLSDKNGKEIYEGDILENLFRGERQMLICKWEDCGLVFNDKRGISRFLTDATVIGNIHDNPELLKGEK